MALSHNIKSLLLAFVALLAPMKPMLVMAMALVVIDLITGILAAKKRGEKITSSGLKRTILKTLVYEAAIILSCLVEKYMTLDMVPACKIVSSFIGITELKSVLENLDEINGGSLFKALLRKLGDSNGEDR